MSCIGCQTEDEFGQFLDILLALVVYRETGRSVQFLVAASSLKRYIIGPFARILRSSEWFTKHFQNLQ